MTLFDLAAKIGLDSSEFEKGVNNAERSGKSLGEKLSSSFDKIKKAAAVALSGAVIKKGVDMVLDLANATSAAGDKIDKQSQALGLSRKAYQEWDYILGQNGASIDSLGVSMKTLNSLVLDAAAGGKESKIAFSKLGVSIHKLETLSMEDQFEAVVRAFQRMPEGAKKSALAVQIFGRNGMELLPLLNQSETSIDELRKRAEELGIIMSDDAVNASVAYNDAMDDLNRTINGLKYSFGAKLLPTLTSGINKMSAYAGKLSNAFQKKGLKGVWDTLVSDFKKIKWPTWDDVRNAAVTAWDTVVKGVKGLAKLVFGEKADGSINWPTWADVKTAAETAWKTIKDGALKIADTAGALIFGRKEDGSVDWPTWEDVKAKATEIWNDVKAKAKSIADTAGALVFGKNEDGTVDWPTWDDVKTKAEEVWGVIKAGALNLAGLVFGKKKDGSVDWPTWDDVKAKASEVWETIKAGAKGLAGLVFGTKEDGSVAWPDLTAVMASFTDWWDNTVKPTIQGAAKWTLQLFGLPEETAESFGNIISAWWDPLKTAAESVLNWALNLPGAPHDAGTQLHDIVVEWWNGVKTNLQDLLNWVLGLPKIGDTDGTSMVDAISTWWTTNVVPFLGDVLNFTLGLFGLPSVEDMVNAIKTWWENVKSSVGNLVINIGTSISDWAGNTWNGITSGISGAWNSAVDTVGGWFGAGSQKHGGGGQGFAKGLWDVPYDGFKAELHRGETVLSASRARDYRDDRSSSIDIPAMVAMMADSIRSSLQDITVRSYLSGRDVTDDVNRNTVRQLKARRFAT